jgi:hypothetical protein
MAGPIAFTKQHPVAVVTAMAVGYIILPWLLGMVGGITGVGIRLPQYGGGSGG